MFWDQPVPTQSYTRNAPGHIYMLHRYNIEFPIDMSIFTKLWSVMVLEREHLCSMYDVDDDLEMDLGRELFQRKPWSSYFRTSYTNDTSEVELSTPIAGVTMPMLSSSESEVSSSKARASCIFCLPVCQRFSNPGWQAGSGIW